MYYINHKETTMPNNTYEQDNEAFCTIKLLLADLARRNPTPEEFELLCMDFQNDAYDPIHMAALEALGAILKAKQTGELE